MDEGAQDAAVKATLGSDWLSQVCANNRTLHVDPAWPSLQPYVCRAL